jgi:hypothetical protein
VNGENAGPFFYEMAREMGLREIVYSRDKAKVWGRPIGVLSRSQLLFLRELRRAFEPQIISWLILNRCVE